MKSFQYEQAFDRNIGWLTLEDQTRLKNAHVAVIGLGGTGGFQCQVLARLGVGALTIMDPDIFEMSNFNRQLGATMESVGVSKAETIEKMIHSINPTLKVRVYKTPLSKDNIDEVFSNVDLVIDGIDFFAIDEKLLLFKRTRELGIPSVTVAPLGFGASVIAFSSKGMDPYEYFDITESMDRKEKAFALAFGLSPKPLCLSYMNANSLNVENKRASSVCPGLMLTGAIAGAEAVKILTGKGKELFAPHVFQIDLLTQHISKKYYWMGMRNPWMRLKKVIVKKIVMGKQ